jgi:hypothetical protein
MSAALTTKLVCALVSSRRGVHLATGLIRPESPGVEWRLRGVTQRHPCGDLLEKFPVLMEADVILVCQQSLRDSLLRMQLAGGTVVLVERLTAGHEQSCEALIRAYAQRPTRYVYGINQVTKERELMPMDAFFDQFTYKPAH